MDFRSTRTALLWAAFAGSSVVHLQAAPLAVTLTDDPTMLASAIFGPGATIVGTPTLSSQPGQSGVFTNFSSGPYTQTGGASGTYSLASGIILTTGIASGAEGNYIGGPSFDASGRGDAMLSAISGSPTFDADVLTIEFTATHPMLGLNFVFASSEYPEFAGSTPADPIGIFVNGTNVALVPGTATPISVNSINANHKFELFHSVLDSRHTVQLRRSDHRSHRHGQRLHLFGEHHPVCHRRCGRWIARFCPTDSKRPGGSSTRAVDVAVVCDRSRAALRFCFLSPKSRSRPLRSDSNTWRKMI